MPEILKGFKHKCGCGRLHIFNYDNKKEEITCETLMGETETPDKETKKETKKEKGFLESIFG